MGLTASFACGNGYPLTRLPLWPLAAVRCFVLGKPLVVTCSDPDEEFGGIAPTPKRLRSYHR